MVRAVFLYFQKDAASRMRLDLPGCTESLCTSMLSRLLDMQQQCFAVVARSSPAISAKTLTRTRLAYPSRPRPCDFTSASPSIYLQYLPTKDFVSHNSIHFK